MTSDNDIWEKIERAQAAEDSFTEAKNRAKLGKLLVERNLYQEASSHYQMAVRLFEDLGKTNHQARSLNHLGVCLVLTGQAEQAINHLSIAADLATKDLPLQAAIKGNLGLAYNTLSDYTNAIKAHKIVLETADIINDQSLRLSALINLSDSYLQDGKYQNARGFALVALDLAKTLQTQSSLILIYDLLGMICSHQADLESAVEYHRKAIQTAQSIGDLHRQGIALANQALSLERLTKLDQAYQAMREASEIFRWLNSDYQEKTHQDLIRIKNAMA
jgi:tetratricopeptide (TPR) repeat protein